MTRAACSEYTLSSGGVAVRSQSICFERKEKRKDDSTSGFHDFFSGDDVREKAVAAVHPRAACQLLKNRQIGGGWVGGLICPRNVSSAKRG